MGLEQKFQSEQLEAKLETIAKEIRVSWEEETTKVMQPKEQFMAPQYGAPFKLEVY